MSKQVFDLIVIGAGPGGYVAAIKAAQLGMQVALIEKKFMGGTCLNEGCIPTKTLLSNAHLLEQVKRAENFGIHVGSISFDFAKMKQRKDAVVQKIRKSLEGLVQSNKITLFKGTAQFLGPQEVKVKGENNVLLGAEKIILATGSEPLDIPAFPCDHKYILNSTSLLDQTSLPKTLAIIGGGYIGCEFASLYTSLGVKVIILEALSSIVSLQGKAISDTLTLAFKKQGIEIHTNTFVEGVDLSPEEGVSIRIKNGTPLLCDQVLVAVGRKIVSQELQVEKAGILLSDKGAILVDEQMQTNVPGIFAIGDVTGKLLLAHVASHQGIIAAVNANGGKSSMHYEAVPAVIFTFPEIATVGLTLEQALEKGISATVGKFPFQALGKAVATLETEGFSQIVIDKKTGQILGAQVVGAQASVLIAEMALAIANELTLDCVMDTVHAHPTMAEAWLEAAFIANETPVHFPPRIKNAR